MYKVLAFDLDGTLAPSKSRISHTMGKMLTSLLGEYEICIISGGDFVQFTRQILDGLTTDTDKLSHLHLMPTCGAQYYSFDGSWKREYAEEIYPDDKKRIVTALEEAIDACGLREAHVYGQVIEDRGTQITYSALGQDIVNELGEEGVRLKEAWDVDGSKKEKLRAYVAARIPEFEVRAGGTTSIDVTRPGVDKAYGMSKLIQILNVSKDDILFFGDKLQPGGNDYPVKKYGIDSREVSSPADTLKLLKKTILN